VSGVFEHRTVSLRHPLTRRTLAQQNDSAPLRRIGYRDSVSRKLSGLPDQQLHPVRPAPRSALSQSLADRTVLKWSINTCASKLLTPLLPKPSTLKSRLPSPFTCSSPSSKTAPLAGFPLYNPTDFKPHSFLEKSHSKGSFSITPPNIENYPRFQIF